MKKVLAAYIPVLHKGYLDLFQRHKDCDELYIIGGEVLSDFDHVVRKDIRRVAPEMMRGVIEGLDIFESVKLLDKKTAKELGKQKNVLVLADDEITRDLATKEFPNCEIEWDKAFLRWHRDNTLEQNAVDPDETVSVEEADRQLMAKAKEVGGGGLDWY